MNDTQLETPPVQPVRRMSWIEAAPVTSVLVGLNAAVFLAMIFSGVPLTGGNNNQLLRWGADYGPLTLFQQPWRILACTYVHIGILHIALNMWCLWSLGVLAERVFDRWTYFLTYTACGLAGSLVSLWRHPIEVSAGASGAIFGLAGALITALYLGKLPVHPQALKHTLKSLVAFAGYNLFFGSVVPGIDNSAHLGGLFAGLLLGAVLAPRLMAPPAERHIWKLIVFLATAVLLYAAFHYVRLDFAHALQMQMQ